MKNKGMKVVKNYGGSRLKKRLPVIIAVLAAVAVFGILIGMNLYDEYHTYHSRAATEFETVAAGKDGYVLATETKELLGKVYAGFSIRDEESGETVYQCPDLYLVKDLQSITWGTVKNSILILQKDGSVITYDREGEKWEKQ